MPHGIVYCRVSTVNQQTEGTSLETQRDACLKRAKGLGLTVPAEYVFLEQASGADLDRPLLAQARELIRRGEAIALVGYSTDRIARDPIHLFIVAEECQDNGAELVLVSEPLDSTPEGKLISYVKGYAAQIEREKTRERTMRGKEATARSGRLPVGTGAGLYGYSYDKTTKTRRILDSEAATVRHIFRMATEGVRPWEIAKQLNASGVPTKTGKLWHPLTIKRLVTNPAYNGETFYGRERVRRQKGNERLRSPRAAEEWVSVDGFTPAIIDAATFASAQRQAAKPSRLGRAIEPYLLAGHAACAHCGRPLVGTMLSKGYRYYRCRGTWPTAVSPRMCDGRYIPAAALEEAVWTTVAGVLEQPELILSGLRELQETGPDLAQVIEQSRRDIKSLRDQEARLIRLYEISELDEEAVRVRATALRAEREAVEATLRQLEDQLAAVRDGGIREDQIRAYCDQVRERLTAFSFEDKRLALDALEIRASADKEAVSVNGIVPLDQGPEFSSNEQSSG